MAFKLVLEEFYVISQTMYRTLIHGPKGLERNVRTYVSEQFQQLIGDRNFEFAVQGAARGAPDREALIF